MIHSRYPQHNVVFVHGKMKQATRMQIVNEFQETPDHRVLRPPMILVGPVGILGTGYTLHRSLRIIITDPDFDSKKEDRSIKRVSRIGTLFPTTAIILGDRLVPVEWAIKEKQRKRKRLARRTVRTAQEAAAPKRHGESNARKAVHV